MNKIEIITTEEISDSRGNPTVKVSVFADDKEGSFSVPSGASTGAHEAHELRDKDGKGVKISIDKIKNIIAPILIGQNVEDQKKIDKIMIDLDGTLDKNRLGGNSMIGVSIACIKTASKCLGMEVFEYLRTVEEIKTSGKVPYLYMNLINGGKHAKNGLAFQEYHIVPISDDPELAIEYGIKIQNTLKEIIFIKYGQESLILGDEGGFAPKISDIREPLLLLTEAIEKNGLVGKVRLALDVAASSFYKDGNYTINGKIVNSMELMEVYDSLISEFNLFSIEDPFDEEDFKNFRRLREGHKELLVVGDDLTVTNISLLEKAIEQKSINAIIIKPNQIGTLSETLMTMKMAMENGVKIIVSHRSGETMDDFIADLAYAFGCFGLKSGSPQKMERKVKYDRLITICKADLK